MKTDTEAILQALQASEERLTKRLKELEAKVQELGEKISILVMIKISEQELDAGAEDIGKLRDELREAAAKIG